MFHRQIIPQSEPKIRVCDTIRHTDPTPPLPQKIPTPQKFFGYVSEHFQSKKKEKICSENNSLNIDCSENFTLIEVVWIEKIYKKGVSEFSE